MAGDVVNLRQVRKRKAKAEDDRRAEANRRLHGMTRAEREKAADEKRRLDAHVEGHRREDDGEGGDG